MTDGEGVVCQIIQSLKKGKDLHYFKIVLFLLRIMVNVVNIYVVCITSVTKAMGFLSCNAMPVISFGILVNAISEVSTIVPIRPA